MKKTAAVVVAEPPPVLDLRTLEVCIAVADQVGTVSGVEDGVKSRVVAALQALRK